MDLEIRHKIDISNWLQDAEWEEIVAVIRDSLRISSRLVGRALDHRCGRYQRNAMGLIHTLAALAY